MPENGKNGRVWKTIVGAGVVFTLILMMIEYDDRLAKSEELEDLKLAQRERITQLETKVVQSMEQFQKNQDIRHYDYLDDMLEKEYFNCRNILMVDPNNQIAQQNCANIEAKRAEIKEKKRALCQ
jgi:hypothetical protein